MSSRAGDRDDRPRRELLYLARGKASDTRERKRRLFFGRRHRRPVEFRKDPLNSLTAEELVWNGSSRVFIEWT